MRACARACARVASNYPFAKLIEIAESVPTGRVRATSDKSDTKTAPPRQHLPLRGRHNMVFLQCLVFFVYIYVLHTNLTAYATFNHSEHCLWINLVHSMHLTEFTTNPTTTDCTRVFPKVKDLQGSSDPPQGSSSFRCLSSGLFSPLQLYTC